MNLHEEDAVRSKVKEIPLCVDMDGTLLATDTLWESLILLARIAPTKYLMLPYWLCKGKAYFKRKLADLVSLHPGILPYKKEVLSFLVQEKNGGRHLFLTTAADYRVAERVSQHTGLFSGVIASNEKLNLSGHRKSTTLSERFGEKGFDYIGNATADIPVWEKANLAIIVNPSWWLSLRTRRFPRAVVIKPAKRCSFLIGIGRALRIHQWVKNVLLGIPALLAHRIVNADIWIPLFCAILSFSCAASTVYIINDLLDLPSDRAHPTKKHRPFAAGDLPIKVGVLTAGFLLVFSIASAWFWISPRFTGMVCAYLALAMAYSFYLKRVIVADVIILAGLYTLRLFAGGVATGIAVSSWLLTFSMFFFMSLAFVKRWVEIQMLRAKRKDYVDGRGYRTSDFEILTSIGPMTGMLSVLVLALYLNSTEVTQLYRNPYVLWLIEPALIYWITRVWLITARGEMQDDPIVFALKDTRSYLLGIFILGVMAVASV